MAASGFWDITNVNSSSKIHLSWVIYRSSRQDVFCKKGVLRNLTKFTGKHLRQSLFFNKVAGEACKFIKKEIWHRCFPVNFVKFLRTPFCIEHPWWLLLYITTLSFKFTWIISVKFFSCYAVYTFLIISCLQTKEIKKQENSLKYHIFKYFILSW